MDIRIDLKYPVPATTLWPSGTHWTRDASPNQVKGPLIAKRKNEGLTLTGDKLCWPRAGPISSIKCKAPSTAGWLPARAPSSR